MAINPYLVIAAANLAINLADYLRQEELPPVAPTSALENPYTPPFDKGQCPVFYNIRVTADIFTSQLVPNQTVAKSILGAIQGFEIVNNGQPQASVNVVHNNGQKTTYFSSGEGVFTFSNVRIANLGRVDGQPDDCGSLPNAVAPPSISSDGLASSPSPNLIDDSPLALGSPLVVIPSVGAAIAAIGAAVRAATDVLAAIKKLMEALETIGDLLDKIKDWLEDKDKDDEKKKTLYSHKYGSLRKDGFLRIYPREPPEGFSPQYLDLQLLSIPLGYGKYFGKLSPNFYRFKSLGHISFVSASLGILETHEIEFTRTSLVIPEHALGFFYHLGLDDSIRANAALFYLKTDE